MSNMFDTQPATPENIFGVVESFHNKNKKVLKTAQIRAANQGIDPLEAYRGILSQVDAGADISALEEQEQLAFVQTAEADMRRYVQENAANPAAQDTIMSMVGNFQAVRDTYLDQFDGINQTYSELFANEDLDSFRKRQVAARMTVQDAMEDMLGERGGLETAGDFAAQMLAPDDIKDFSDYAKLLGTDIKGIQREMSTFQTLDPEEQMAVIEERLPFLIEAFDDNPFAVRAAVEMYYSDDIVQDFIVTGAFDALAVLDVVGLSSLGARALVKVANAGTRARSAAKTAKDLDNTPISAALNNVAGADKADEALKAVDVTRTDVAATAHPAKLEDTVVLSGQMDNVAAAVQDARKTTVQQAMEAAIKAAPVVDGKPRVAATQMANISRISQGDIPEEFRPLFTEAVQQELTRQSIPVEAAAKQSLRADAAAAAGDNALLGKSEVLELAATPRLLDSPEVFGVDPEYAQLLKDEIRTPVRGIVEDVQKQAPDALRPEDIARAEQKAEANIKRAVEEAGTSINSLTTTRTPNGFRMEYTTEAGDADTYVHNFTVSDAGALVTDPKQAVDRTVGEAMRNVLSPDVVYRHLLGTFTSDVTYAGQQTDRLRNKLLKKYADLEKGVSKESKQHVDALLMAGDESGMVFTPDELSGGLVELRTGKEGFKRAYTREEQNLYYRKRAFLDELHEVRNTLTRDQLEFLGMKGVRYTDKDGVARESLGKPTDSFGDPAVNPVRVFDNLSTEGKSWDMTSRATVQKYIDEGYQPIRLLEPIQIGKKKITHGLARTDQVHAMPKQVLNYQNGYVPRVYQPGYFFVKDVKDGKNTTLYAFEKKVDAEDYAQQLRDDGERVVVKGDREFTDLEKMTNSADQYGGLYTGSRKSTPLMVLRDGEEFRPERLSVAQATQRYMQSVANVTPVNTYRMAMVERWRQTVNQLAKLEGKDTGIDTLQGLDGNLNLSDEAGRVMNDSREYLRDTLSIPSDAESFFNRGMARIGEVMRGKKGGDWVLNNIHGDPVKAMKGLTFNAHMGWFNVRQLFVQAQNASIALSIAPTKAPAAFYNTLAMRSVVYSANEDVWRAAAKTAKIDPEEFVENVREFKRSGLMDSIARTADLDSNLNGLGTGTFETMRKLAKAGRIPYEEGEGFSRLMAWNIARANLKDQGVELTARNVSDETVRLHMNMQRENAAKWQNSAVFGVPTQFMQVFAKFVENMLPGVLGTGKWTNKEKARVLAGQLALYGTIGVPLMDDMFSHVAEVTGTTPLEVERNNPLFKEAVEEGLVGVLTGALGFDNNFSESGSLLAGLDDTVVTELGSALVDYLNGDTYTGQTNVFDMSLGASGNTVKRTADAIGGTFDAAVNIFTNPSPATLGTQMIEVVEGWGSITSTWSNARKARYARHYGVGLRSNRGTLLMTSEELGFDWATTMARAFGFQSDKEVDLFRALDYDMDSKKAKADTRRDLKEAWIDFQKTGDEELYHKRSSLILGGHDNPLTRQELIRAHNKEIVKGQSLFGRTAKSTTKQILEAGSDETVPSFTATTGDTQ